MRVYQTTTQRTKDVAEALRKLNAAWTAYEMARLGLAEGLASIRSTNKLPQVSIADAAEGRAEANLALYTSAGDVAYQSSQTLAQATDVLKEAHSDYKSAFRLLRQSKQL